MPSSARKVASLDLPTFPRRQIQRAYNWFEFHVYRGHRPMSFRLRKVLRTWIDQSPWLYRGFMRLLPLWHALRRS